MAKRALTIAAAGAHNLLMLGRPGRARRCSPNGSNHIATVDGGESIETTRIYSVLGRLQPDNR